MNDVGLYDHIGCPAGQNTILVSFTAQKSTRFASHPNLHPLSLSLSSLNPSCPFPLNPVPSPVSLTTLTLSPPFSFFLSWLCLSHLPSLCHSVPPVSLSLALHSQAHWAGHLPFGRATTLPPYFCPNPRGAAPFSTAHTLLTRSLHSLYKYPSNTLLSLAWALMSWDLDRESW
jgi:hypothetical protein